MSVGVRSICIIVREYVRDKLRFRYVHSLVGEIYKDLMTNWQPVIWPRLFEGLINGYPQNKCQQNKPHYPLDSDLSGG